MSAPSNVYSVVNYSQETHKPEPIDRETILRLFYMTLSLIGNYAGELATVRHTSAIN